MALAPIQFDRTSGALEGANLWERTAALALVTGSKISSHFSHRGYNGCANLLRKTLPERNIAIKLNADAVFEFPYGDGYWSKLLNRSYHYEDELELLFRDSADVDYTLIDCGANYGYWSVLVSSAPLRLAQGDRDRAVVAEFSQACQQCRDQRQPLRADEMRDRRRARQRAALRHQARSVQHRRRRRQRRRGSAGHRARQSASTTARLSASGKYLIKLDVEGVEIEAIKGGARLLQGDSVILCEEHGNDPDHTVSRYILEQTPLKLIVYDPRSNRLETVTELSILDRIKVSSHVGYNVFGTASAFWQNRINALNANAARRMQ